MRTERAAAILDALAVADLLRTDEHRGRAVPLWEGPGPIDPAFAARVGRLHDQAEDAALPGLPA